MTGWDYDIQLGNNDIYQEQGVYMSTAHAMLVSELLQYDLAGTRLTIKAIIASVVTDKENSYLVSVPVVLYDFTTNRELGKIDLQMVKTASGWGLNDATTQITDSSTVNKLFLEGSIAKHVSAKVKGVIVEQGDQIFSPATQLTAVSLGATIAGELLSASLKTIKSVKIMDTKIKTYNATLIPFELKSYQLSPDAKQVTITGKCDNYKGMEVNDSTGRSGDTGTYSGFRSFQVMTEDDRWDGVEVRTESRLRSPGSPIALLGSSGGFCGAAAQIPGEESSNLVETSMVASTTFTHTHAKDQIAFMNSSLKIYAFDHS